VAPRSRRTQPWPPLRPRKADQQALRVTERESIESGRHAYPMLVDRSSIPLTGAHGHRHRAGAGGEVFQHASARDARGSTLSVGVPQARCQVRYGRSGDNKKGVRNILKRNDKTLLLNLHSGFRRGACCAEGSYAVPGPSNCLQFL
jgi:hypothetical protein